MTADGKFDRSLIAVCAVVVLGTIMSILDTTIVNVAIDTLARDFDSSLSSIQWVVTGYMLALASVIPLTGWAAERFGIKRVWLTSVVLFLLGSAVCGLAWSTESLVVFRVIQGIGGGMIMPVGMTLLAQTAGPDRVGRIMSVVGVPMLLGPVLGPVLGGWLVTDFSWRWIFFVNLPIGAIALPLAWRVLSWDKPKGKAPLDLQGLFLLSPGAALLVYGLSETASSGGFTGAGALGGILGGLALIVGFVFHAGRTEHPLIDLSLFKEKAFSAAAATTFLLGATLFGAMILMPLYFQIVRGEDALSAGLLLAPQGLGAACAMPIAGRMTDRGAAGKIVLIGLSLVMIGTFAYTQLTATTSYTLLAFSLFVRGVGIGSSMMPAMSAAYQTLSPAAVPRATSALNVINRVGGSLGTAILAVILQHEITTAVPSAGGAGLEGLARTGEGAARIAGPVSNAFGNTFWWSLALTLVAIAPALLLPRSRPAGPAAPGGPSRDPRTEQEPEFAAEAALA